MMRINLKQNRTEGSIALITVIVISGILLASGIAVILLSADLAIASQDYSAKVRMESALRTCLEESLFRVKGDIDFVGDVSYTNGFQQCSSVVSDDPITPDVKIISVDASYDGYGTTDEFSVDVSSEPFQILD